MFIIDDVFFGEKSKMRDPEHALFSPKVLSKHRLRTRNAKSKSAYKYAWHDKHPPEVFNVFKRNKINVYTYINTRVGLIVGGV